jgi:hypothetical protein
MMLRLIHDADGEIVSFVPPGAELPGPAGDGHSIAEVEAHGLDPNDLHLQHLQAGYTVDCASDPPRLVPREMEGTPRSGAGRPLPSSATFPPQPVQGEQS